jgi:hypothetical protein
MMTEFQFQPTFLTAWEIEDVYKSHAGVLQDALLQSMAYPAERHFLRLPRSRVLEVARLKLAMVERELARARAASKEVRLAIARKNLEALIERLSRREAVTEEESV